MPPRKTSTGKLSISPLQTEDDACTCARLMTASEPWITLGRSYEASLCIIQGYIQTICIDPARRGQGLGSRLVEFAEQRIVQVSPNVFMCVSSFNPAARRLYERLGYKVVGELTDYIVRGHSEFLLRKTLGPLTGFNSKSPGRTDQPVSG